IKLLQQHDSGELMRPGRGAESEPHRRLVAQARGEAIIATDDEYRRGPAVVAPAAQPLCQRGAVEAFAALVKQDGDGIVGDRGRERDRLLGHALADLLGAAFADFHNFGVAEADAAADLLGALSVAFRQFPLRAVLQPSDGGDDETHVTVSWPYGRAFPPTSFRSGRRRGPPAGTRGR